MKNIHFLSIILLSIFFWSCTQQEPIRLRGNVFGTSYSIIYFDTDTNYQRAIDSLFTHINGSLSTYMPTSDISKINSGAKGIKVDAYFKEVFQKSERIFKETEGYFDPTVGTLVNAWGFGPEKPLENLDAIKVKELMHYTGFNKVQLQGDSIVKQHPKIYFDFNAIAKGYGIDVVGRFLESQGITNYLVEIGGEIRARGQKPDGKDWTVQIENPVVTGAERKAFELMQISNQSMASSGNYRKFRVSDSGEKFVHTINPKTGFAKESNLLAATVIAALDCADVDAYATTFMAMGLEKSIKFLKLHPELKAILIYANEQGELEAYRN